MNGKTKDQDNLSAFAMETFRVKKVKNTLELKHLLYYVA